MHEPDAVVVRRAPDAGVRRDRQVELAGHLEGGPLGEGRVAGDVEGELQAEQVAAAALEEGPHRRVGRPLPRAGLDVAVGEHEPAGHAAQRVDRRLGVLDGLQAVRPVDGGGHPGLEGVPGREQVAGVHVLRPERPAVLEVVPDEVLGERPVGAVAAHRGLPHVPVGVDHAGHHDAAGGVDLEGALRGGEPGADLGDAVVDDEHVGAGQHPVLVVHREHRAVAEQHRPAGGHLVVSHDLLPFNGSDGCPSGGTLMSPPTVRAPGGGCQDPRRNAPWTVPARLTRRGRRARLGLTALRTPVRNGSPGSRWFAWQRPPDPWPACSSPTSRASSPAPTRRCCSPTSAPTWSRSSLPVATTPAPGARRCATGSRPTTSASTAASARSRSTSGTTPTSPPPASWPAGPTCSSRTSSRAAWRGTASTTRASRPATPASSTPPSAASAPAPAGATCPATT